MNRRARQRRLHVVGWLIVTGVLLGAVDLVSGVDVPVRQELSLGFAYTSLVALVVTLGLGPVNVLLRRPNPLSTDLRRDAGLAAALTAAVHTALSLTNHFGGDVVAYFFVTRTLALRSVRHDWFGLGVWVGAIGVLLMLLLASISSDVAIRRLGRRRWKQVQRWNYVLAVTVVVHSVAFWFALSRAAVVVVLAIVLVAAVAVLQLAGLRRRTRPS